MKPYLIAMLLTSIAAVTPLHAQSTESGRITGVVKDGQGGVLPGATVTLTGPSRLTETICIRSICAWEKR